MSVAYINVPQCEQYEKSAFVNKKRCALTRTLIEAYDLFDSDGLRIVNAKTVPTELLQKAHSLLYLTKLKAASRGEIKIENELEKFGLIDDAAIYPDVWNHAVAIASASYTAARCILDGTARTVISWSGGRHHAAYDSAGGFCYINDVNICIFELLTRYSRIAYIDLDYHHGDGVQHAFYDTSSVLFLSVHRYGPGVYPGTGHVQSIGDGDGHQYTVNIPVLEGLTDGSLFELMKYAIDNIVTPYHPDVIVVQCGLDWLSGDPLCDGNLSDAGYRSVIKLLEHSRTPMILLGGGGYNDVNAARTWCSVTADVCGVDLDSDIPEHEHYVPSSSRRDYNTGSYLTKLIERLKWHANQLYHK